MEYSPHAGRNHFAADRQRHKRNCQQEDFSLDNTYFQSD